jgi:hypothetical protein
MSDYFGAMGTALFSALSGGTALTAELGGTAIYNTQAPDNKALPYVVYSHQGGGPNNITKSDLRENVWYVRAYGPTLAKATAIDRQIDAILNRKALSVSGYACFWCAREQDFQIVETPASGTHIYSAGAFYRIRITD